MKDRLSTLPIAKAEPLYRQIEHHLRNLLQSGEYPPDTKLPSTQELAAIWNTQALTIQTALSPLVKEGLLVRYPRKGTFVRQREEKLTCVGLVYASEVLAPGVADFVLSFQTQLKRLLEEQGIEMSVWIDTRPKSEQGRAWPALCNAARKRKVQALIVPHVDWPRLDWMIKLPVPTAYMSAANLPNTVHLDRHQFFEKSLEHLVSRGCRSVGVIWPLPVDEGRPFREGEEEPVTDMVGTFLDLVSDLGLEVRNEWMRVPKDEDAPPGVSPQAFGFREFRQLWAQARRPAGVVITDDVVMRGVIPAVLEAGVEVPAQLQLVSHKNKHVELLSPFPVSYVELDERELAQMLIEQVQKQFRGERCERKSIGFTLAP